ncbi:MAG: hypothetical protein U0V72_03510 [Cytophagales bacterium]
MNTIKFQNVEYKVREIELPQLGNVFISTSTLNDALMNNGNDYVSEEAQSIDENIFYYIEESEIELNEADLIKLVSQQTA